MNKLFGVFFRKRKRNFKLVTCSFLTNLIQLKFLSLWITFNKRRKTSGRKIRIISTHGFSVDMRNKYGNSIQR